MRSIVVEYKADEAMVQALLGQPRQAITHQANKGSVCNFLRKHAHRLTAIVDEDPHSGQPPLLKPVLTAERLHGIRSGIVLGRHLAIVLCPRLEEWVLSQAGACGLDLKKAYGLPNDASSLHKEVTRRLGAWSELLSELALRRPPGVARLQHLISSGT